MKKLVAVVAATLIAPTLVAAAAAPSAAQAAPRDPVAALKLQFAKKGGVRVDDSLRATFGRDALLRGRVSGVARFGPAGVNALDLKSSVKGSSLKFEAHSIATGKYYYVRSKDIAKELPEGKKWVRLPGGPALTRTMGAANLVNALDARALKTVLATTKSRMPGGRVAGTRTVLYRGAIGLRQLGKVSEQARVMAKVLKGEKRLPVVSWKLWVGGGDKLPRRFTTSLVLLSDPKLGKAVISADTRFSGWGTRTPVKAPPAAQVIDIEDWSAGEELAETFTGQALVPFGDPYEGLTPEK